MTAPDARRGPALLAIDTATSRVVIALGSSAGGTPGGNGLPPTGAPDAQASWVAGRRHGETLMPTIDRLLGQSGVRRADLAGIVVGTGPGTFTGLRVGLATAKGLAHGLGIPIVGISSGAALLAADAAGQAGSRDGGPVEAAGSPDAALILPAGPQDRVLVHDGVARLLPAGTEPDLPPGTALVAMDLDGRAPADAVARGDTALAGLGGALLRLGRARLEVSGGDDLARLVPEYVSLPRGVRREAGEVTWSRDRR
jgi:tRNA threonylcarbamoyl adenosine modification protein YeaZ